MVYLFHLFKFLVKLDNPLVICDWKHGKEYEWYENGKIWIIINWANGKRHGKRYRWNNNGKIRSISNWINDQLHGKHYEWHENGKIWSITNWINDTTCPRICMT